MRGRANSPTSVEDTQSVPQTRTQRPRMWVMDVNGYEHLANAVIVQACHDYRLLATRLKKSPENVVLQGEILKLEQFFRSEWFQVLSEADGEQILKQLQREGE